MDKDGRKGTGEPKKWDSGMGKSTSPMKKKEYHMVGGKLEEYGGRDYVDDKSSKPMKQDPHEQHIKDIIKSRPRY